jgi:ribosomal protein L12E/L44/L45/RPP1/RPP2
LYVLAKLAEVADARILALTGGLSGHSLKHLLAAAASAAVIFALSQRQSRKL